jgi:peptidoglycan/xylan/chitin deacetylase (PgdA/CDA1 family)
LTAAAAAAWLLAAVGRAGAAGGYVAPTANPPGGLRPEDTPQIMLLTFDDLVDPERFALLQQVLPGHWNPNGTPLQATFFLNTDWTDFWLVQQLHAQGHEIAVHTMTHTTGTGTDAATWRAEIAGCRKVVSDLAAVPRAEIVGFRAPYLKYNDASFRILAEQGFAYDASIIEAPGSLSPDGRSFIWPYTLEQGVPQACWTGACPTSGVPGLFEIPLWNLLGAGGSSYASMDPEGTYEELTAVLQANFADRYTGNRAPMGVFLHADWLSAAPNAAALNDFIDWTLSHSNVWWVSMADLVAFMRDPQAAAEAHAFPPFVTATHPLPPTSLVSRCVYEAGEFRTSAPCPDAWPRTDTVYAEAGPMSGGTATVSMVNLYTRSYWARIVVSNTTDREAVDWAVSFQLVGGTVADTSDCLVETNGARVVVRPDGWLRPLAPGEVETVEFGGPRSGTVGFLQPSLALRGLQPRRPAFTGARAAGGPAVFAWDDSAYGYRIERATDLAAGDWTPVADVHGATSWSPGDAGGSGFFRIRPVP